MKKKIPRKKMVKDEVVDVRNAHLGPPQAKIPSELQINCGYDLFQNFQPFFFSWRSGLNQTPSILQGPSNWTSPQIQPQAYIFIMVNYGQCDRCVHLDFFIDFIYLGTAHYKYGNIVSVGDIIGGDDTTR